jgi:hypothetical protein
MELPVGWTDALLAFVRDMNRRLTALRLRFGARGGAA